jgi:hypothetical protein
MRQKYYVYKHLNPTTGDVFYIGMGTGLRIDDFKNGRNKYYLSYVSKYGTPRTEIIKENLTEQAACDLEVSLIKKYGRKYLGEGCLVNISSGGESGVKGRKYKMTPEHKKSISQSTIGVKKHTNESKNKISKSHKGKSKPEGFGDKISKALKGRKQSPEWSENISKSKKGMKITWDLNNNAPRSNKHKWKAVNKLDMQGNFITLYESMKQAGKDNGIHLNTISACCTGVKKHGGGFKWEYASNKSYKDETTKNS